MKSHKSTDATVLTEVDWEAAWEEADLPAAARVVPPGFKTAAALARERGMSISHLQAKLNEMIAAGTMECIKAIPPGLGGRPYPQKMYRPIIRKR